MSLEEPNLHTVSGGAQRVRQSHGRATPGPNKGRTNQKVRTRRALVQAAAELLAEGKRPSILDAADAALVSRTTAYRYFPSQEALLLEAANQGALSDLCEHISDQVGDSPDPADRLDSLVVAFQTVVSENEAALRTVLGLSLERGSGGPTVRAETTYRPYWLDKVLEPLDDALTGSQRRRLVASLSLCMGLEAQITLRDVHGLSADEAREVCRSTARTVLDAAVREASERESRKRTRPPRARTGAGRHSSAG